MILGKTGEIQCDGLPLAFSPALTTAELEKIGKAIEARPILCNAGLQHENYGADVTIGGEKFGAMLSFYKGRLYMVSLSSKEHEDDKAYHDAFLKKISGGKQDFPWGRAVCEADAKAGWVSILITYRDTFEKMKREMSAGEAAGKR
jgi:hypothetical protein